MTPKRIAIFIGVLILSLLAGYIASAQQTPQLVARSINVRLKWDASPTATGYRVSWAPQFVTTYESTNIATTEVVISVPISQTTVFFVQAARGTLLSDPSDFITYSGLAKPHGFRIVEVTAVFSETLTNGTTTLDPPVVGSEVDLILEE